MRNALKWLNQFLKIKCSDPIDMTPLIIMFHKTRMKLAFLLAPIVPSLFMVVLLYSSGYKAVILALMFSIPISYFSCFVFGFPIISYLKKKQRLNIINIVLSGALLGAIVFYIFGFGFSALLDSYRHPLPNLVELVSGAVLGISVALPFGLIAGLPFFKIKKQVSTN